ncbi:glutamine--fructose-6-phosphate transaminase (isomerizing) [Lampropedia puyangensis]|uniref:Glutamine--fructose-6-phosphate aminotransferase [isomerizing] n=1 Tax=Lampropedia puyangensis TaxID=1330072 RepID=A0A4S8EY72_9BURK|nr:glutamine--fructose-6-phosphate transaminase (isomerizing) [Lampropedia puyangensis]THT99230.1 glutamine--fructose-6-phosphate transaminase (isomerizing) [Lampropedia puyangensis]
MCGIVGGVAHQDVVPVLLQGLQRLEYRGYDSCGLAVHTASLNPTSDQGLHRTRSTARVAQLQTQIDAENLQAATGIAHTRWATHGAPSVDNAHPHFSFGPHPKEQKMPESAAHIALVHNGIIENYEVLRRELEAKNYIFTSDTDTEVVAHLIDSVYNGDLFDALKEATTRLHGAYALAVMHRDEPHRLVGARAGSPLVLGVVTGDAPAHYLASDAMALSGVTDQIIYLEEGDLVDLQAGKYWITDAQGRPLNTEQRPVQTVQAFAAAAELEPYQHYMQKEIFEQPRALADTLTDVLEISPELFGDAAHRHFNDIDSVLILACGTSYYSGLVAKYWLEAIAKIPTQVEIASEYRYRESVPTTKALVVVISQSGETADTLAALRHAKSLGHVHTLTVCNVATSTMVRECALAYITRAGVEIGVASTKAFTTQLAGLYLLTLALAQNKHTQSDESIAQHLHSLRHIPAAVQAVLALEPQIISWARSFIRMDNALFLGRGAHYPIALEGALKLKEISYIHAEAYPAGELKHGPLALVTSAMPVVVVAPNDALLEKLKSNMQEVRARGGVLYVLADAHTSIENSEGIHVIRMPEHYGALSPILHVIPLQLLAYHTALGKGTDVDKPRNLAKSVTVE